MKRAAAAALATRPSPQRVLDLAFYFEEIGVDVPGDRRWIRYWLLLDQGGENPTMPLHIMTCRRRKSLAEGSACHCLCHPSYLPPINPLAALH